MLQSNYTRGQRGIKMYKLLIVDDEQIEREGGNGTFYPMG